MTQKSISPTPRKWRLGAVLFLFMLTVLALVAVLALPWTLSTLPGRAWLLSRAARTMSPAELRVDGLRFSWFGPTRIHGFQIITKNGGRVVTAETATWDRNLFQILFQPLRLGTLRLDRPEINVVRASDGTIDLEETLRPVIGRDPRTAARIEVRDGRLRVSGQGLVEPIVAEHAEIIVKIAPVPGPLVWQANLCNGDVRSPRNTLKVGGRLDRKGTPDDLELSVEGRRWPLTLGEVRGGASGRYDGRLTVVRKAARWALQGDAAITQVVARWPGLKGENIQVDRIGGVWWTEQTAEGWIIRKCEITTPRATFKSQGMVSVAGKVRLVGEADLSGVPARAHGLGGNWSLDATLGKRDGGYQVDGTMDVTPKSRDPGDAERFNLHVRASTPEGFGRIDVPELGLKSRYVRFDASGKVDDPSGNRRVELTGKLSPNWDAINAWLAKNVEPGARVSGRERDFNVRGSLDQNWQNTTAGEIGLAIDGADVYGMKIGPVAAVIRALEGKFTIDPIDTTVNGGVLHLEPEIQIGGETGPSLRLGKGTTLTAATVNDEVSRRVLSYVAPVLDNATRVRGRVSGRIDKAEFPILEKAGGRGPMVEGAVVFQDLEFVPGPLLDGLFALNGRDDRPTLKLNDPVSLTIANRRVSQRGLTIPIGNVSKIEIEGSVGFDRTLDLLASVPVLPTNLVDRPILNALAADARIRVPIRGTLQAPEIDREAFKAGLKEMGGTLLGRGALEGAAGLFERLARPRDPNAPLPPSVEERRAMRRERRVERQIRRGRVPE